ncbi:MAG: SAM-dependent methyltransferase [Candidatus Odinarchaeota archaeon]
MKNQQISQDAVRNYFDKTGLIYRSWSKDHLHMGLWDKNTKTHNEALENMVNFVSRLLKIEKGDRVLDAGCGIGGSTRYIASKFGVETVGINISRVQLHKAVRLSKNVKNSSLISYYDQDFTKTAFASGSFTKILAIESVCHAQDKSQFIEEAFRLLKKGGRLVVADGFQEPHNMNEKEELLLQRFLRGLAVPNLESFNSFSDKLRMARFSNIQCYDKTNEVMKSLWRIYRSAKRVYPPSYLLSKLRILNDSWYGHLEASYAQKKLVDLKIFRYGIIAAEK